MRFDKESEGAYRYMLSTDVYNKLDESKVIEEASMRCGVPKGVVHAVWMGVSDAIISWATEGHAVPIPGLGTMRFAVKAKAVDSVDDVASSLITSRRIQFRPSTEIREQFAKTGINITCYDRDGRIVRRVKSNDTYNAASDDMDETDVAEDNQTPTGNGGQNPNPNPLADE